MLLTVRHMLESSATVHWHTSVQQRSVLLSKVQCSHFHHLPSLCVILLLQCKVQCVVGAAGSCALAAAMLRVGAVWVLER